MIKSETTPFSVFTLTSSDTFSSYCSKQSYKLFDSTGSNDVSSTTSPYTFNTTTGEFKITIFTGYFSQIFYVQVTNQVNSDSSKTVSIKSGPINVTYYKICTPSINGLSSLFNYSINVLKFPFTIFKASDFASTAYPAHCTLSYQILN